MVDLDHVRMLFREYASQLGVDLCFQNFERELVELPGSYAPPGGRLHVVYRDGNPAACVALRQLSESVCELKRLYVRPPFRGTGLGLELAQMMISEAAGIGYTAMRLDTLPTMGEAIGLYRRLGFREIPAYTTNPVPGALFFEFTLRKESEGSADR